MTDSACFIKTGHIASRRGFRWDMGQTGQKRDVPAKTGRLTTLNLLGVLV